MVIGRIRPKHKKVFKEYFSGFNQKHFKTPEKVALPNKLRKKPIKEWSMNSCYMRDLCKRIDFDPKPNKVLKKRKRNPKSKSIPGFKGTPFKIREVILELFELGKSVPEIQ